LEIAKTALTKARKEAESTVGRFLGNRWKKMMTCLYICCEQFACCCWKPTIEVHREQDEALGNVGAHVDALCKILNLTVGDELKDFRTEMTAFRQDFPRRVTQITEESKKVIVEAVVVAQERVIAEISVSAPKPRTRLRDFIVRLCLLRPKEFLNKPTF
jgi:hypothetical protein